MRFLAFLFVAGLASSATAATPISDFDKLLIIKDLSEKKSALETEIHKQITDLYIENKGILVTAYIYKLSPPCLCPPNAECEACVQSFQISQTPGTNIPDKNLITIQPFNDYSDAEKNIKIDPVSDESDKLKLSIQFQYQESGKISKRVVELVPGKKYDFFLNPNGEDYYLNDVRPTE